MHELLKVVRWLLGRVINDPVKFPLVLMFLALVFAIYLLSHR